MSESESSGSEDSVETNSTSSSSEDEDDDLPKDSDEKDFLKTLSCLKNKDPQIYDKNVQFFVEDDKKVVDKKVGKNKGKKEKEIYVNDYEREILTKEELDESDAECVPKSLTYYEEQKVLKDSFKNFVNADSSDDEDANSLLKKKEKGVQEKLKEEEDYIQWLKGKKKELNDKETESELKPLYEYWNDPALDKKEEFLKDYILNKRYLEKDSLGNYDGSDLSEDEKLLEAQENFEHNYNFRFEGEDSKTIKRYPRTIEGSMRRKNDSRKRKREEVQKRKKEEKEKKKLEIKKKQKEKLNEIKDKIEQLKKITGNVELGFKDEEILEDFDPDKYDKKMQELYNDKFYAEEIDEKPDFSNFDEDDGDGYIDDINMDCEAELNVNHEETRSKKKRKKKKSKSYTDICDIVKPVFDPEKHDSFQNYIDQYYNLDCEDFIDDIPCRFKYRDVVPNDFGLSVEEILLADEKELNRWASAKKICKLRPTQVEKNEVKIYKQKARDEHLKRKLLPSIYKVEEEKEEEEGGDEIVKKEPEEKTSKEEEPVIDKATEKKGMQPNKNNSPKEKVNSLNNIKKKKNNLHKTIKNKNQFKKANKCKGNSRINGISDSRLLAYNIKPKQFRSKLKHAKSRT